MKFKLAVLSFLSSSILIANNFHTTLLLPMIDRKNPHWSYAGKKISEKEDEIFHKLIEKWEGILAKIYDKLDNKIYEDIGASINTIDFYMQDQRFIDSYSNHCKQALANIIETQTPIDPLVANYMIQKLTFLQLEYPITVYMSNHIQLPIIAFGTNQTEHCIILNKNIYNKNDLNEIYKMAAENKYNFMILPHSQNHSSRAIEHANYLHLHLAQAASSIRHQGDYFSKMLLFFMYNNKRMSEQTQGYGTCFLYLHSLLEASLQSNNPLEAAIFIEPIFDNMDHEFIFLWRDFIKDIQNCYNPEDLQDYEQLLIEERRASLYTNQNE